MTPKMTALRNTVKLVGFAALVGTVTVVLLMNVPLIYLGIAFTVVVALYMVHMIYELELEKAKCLRLFENHNAIQKFDDKSES